MGDLSVDYPYVTTTPSNMTAVPHHGIGDVCQSRAVV
jgi:hypothetical protein